MSMTIALQGTRKRTDLLELSLKVGCLSLVPPIIALLRLLGVSALPVLLLVGIAAYFWLVLRHPIGVLGAALALMPVFPLTFLVAKFFGPPYLALFDGCDRAVILSLVCVLCWRNGIKFLAPDWLLLTFLLIPVL